MPRDASSTESQLLIVFVATLMIATLFNFPFFNPAQATNQHLKQAGSAQGVNDILAKWGEAGQEAARRNLALDWLFIVVYAATWIAAGRHFWLLCTATLVAGYYMAQVVLG